MDETPSQYRITGWIRRNTLLIGLAFAFAVFVFPQISPFETVNYYLGSVQRLSRWMVGRVESLFQDYGYYVVFFGVLMENSMFLGLLIPGALILLLGGLAAENGAINIWWVFALAITATIIGDTVSYLIGRSGWSKALKRGGMGEMIERVRTSMDAHSGWIILAYHFAGYSRVVGPAAAGMFHIPYRRWAPFDYLGGALWVVAFTMLGYMLGVAGVDFGDTKRIARIIEYTILAGLVIAVVVVYTRQARSGGDNSSDDEGGRPATVIIPADD